MSTIDIKQLLESAQDGDQNALREIINHYKDDLFRFLVHLTRNHELANDILQESFLKLLTKIDTIKKPEQLKSWLFRIAKNQFIDHTRKKANTSSVALDSVPEIQDQEFDTDKERQVFILQEAIKRLPEKERIIIVCVDLEQRSYSEASEILEISESALKSRLFRARKLLKNIFEEIETSG